MATEARALPAGSVLVHIGPYKTGSTAIQHSLAAHRDDLERHGVCTPAPTTDTCARVGRSARTTHAAALRRSRCRSGTTSPPPFAPARPSGSASAARTSSWPPSARQPASSATSAATASTCCSSPGVSIGCCLRHGRSGSSRPTRRSPTTTSWPWSPTPHAPSSSPDFWHNHELSAIGPLVPSVPAERLHVLVADESRRDRTARVFEQLLGLPDGPLAPPAAPNASLSFERVDLPPAVTRSSTSAGGPLGQAQADPPRPAGRARGGAHRSGGDGDPTRAGLGPGPCGRARRGTDRSARSPRARRPRRPRAAALAPRARRRRTDLRPAVVLRGGRTSGRGPPGGADEAAGPAGRAAPPSRPHRPGRPSERPAPAPGAVATTAAGHAAPRGRRPRAYRPLQDRHDR